MIQLAVNDGADDQRYKHRKRQLLKFPSHREGEHHHNCEQHRGPFKKQVKLQYQYERHADCENDVGQPRAASCCHNSEQQTKQNSRCEKQQNFCGQKGVLMMPHHAEKRVAHHDEKNAKPAKEFFHTKYRIGIAFSHL